MEDIKQNIANNIIELRKEKKWTQAELAEHLHYSDKAISKWERGESTPDVNSLKELADIFGVTVDYFFHKSYIEKKKFKKPTNRYFYNRLIIIILAMIGVLLISTVVFVWAIAKNLSNASSAWISFLYAIPACSLISFIFTTVFKRKIGMIVSISVLVWSLMSCIYFNVLFYGDDNIWPIFFVAIPFQIAFIVMYFFKGEKEIDNEK